MCKSTKNIINITIFIELFLKTTAKAFHFVSKNTNNMTKSHTCNTILYYLLS